MAHNCLIADSGSTKTDWLLFDSSHQRVARCKTRGINPFMLDTQQIEAIIRQELITDRRFCQIHEIQFYGAGCRDRQCCIVERALRNVWPELESVTVQSDLVGAARALYPEGDGIACILGTGSNSGLYVDGEIKENISPLGFILGDEGSGAVLGRRLLGDILKKQMPDTVISDFHEVYPLSADEIVRKVYRDPMPNRFLASFAPFLYDHRQIDAVHLLLVDEFTRFFQRNVALYSRPDLSVSFVGSIAYYFKEELAEAARLCGFALGCIKREPLD